METPDFREIARQLRQPEGEMGKAVAQRMNINNAPMYQAAFPALGMEKQQHILEIGPGNGAFVPEMLGLAQDLTYTGCDFSPTMVEEAVRMNKGPAEDGQARFLLCDAAELPFNGPVFDRVLAINTLYFWEEPEKELGEILRVTKPGGRLVMGIRPAEIMRNLPFTQYGFRLYGKAELKDVLERSGYRKIRIEEHDEPAQEVAGEPMALSSLIAVAEKA